MKMLRWIVAFLFLIVFAPMPEAQADTATAQASVSVTIPATCTLSLGRDTGSSTRGTATQILFDKLDSADMPSGDAGLMYAPYRSEGGNWHVAQVSANGNNISLSIAVTGTVGSTSLASLLKVWCGGFFKTNSGGIPITGTPSTVWETAGGWSRSLTGQAFTGTVPFNYQLDISSIPSGTYALPTGAVTFTLAST